jgi:hypothetical protein
MGGIAMLLLSIFVPFMIGAIAPALGLGGILTTASGGLSMIGKIVSMGIIAGVGYLLSKATQPKSNTEQDKKTYGVSGGGNIARPGDRIPVNYGKTWTQPDLSQADYFTYEEEGTLNDPDDQILLKRLVLGLGRYRVETIKVGDAIAWTRGKGKVAPFDKMELEFIDGSKGERSELVPSAVYSSPNVQGVEMPYATEAQPWIGPFPLTEPGERTNKAQLDYSWPNGYWGSGKKGRVDHGALGIVFEICEIDDDGNRKSGYTELHKDQRTGQANGAVRITKMKAVPNPKKRYAVRARNLSPELTQAQLDQGISVNDTLYWDGLRGWMGKEPVHRDTYEIAMKVSANAMGSTTAFSDVWVEATKIVPVWNGSSWNEVPTRSAVWAAVDAIRNESYGGAVPDLKVDLATFLHYASSIDRYNTFDGQIRGPVSVVEAVNTILGVVRAEALVMGDVWSMTRDEPRAFTKHTVTRREIVKDSSGIEFDMDMQTGESDVIVSYDSDCDPKRRNEVRETIGAETITPRRIQAFGVSSIDHARHLAKWYAATAYYRRENRLVTTEMQGRIFMRNEAALIDCWFLNGVQASAAMSVSGTTITLDSDIVPAASDYVMLRDNRGLNWGPCRVTQGASARQIVLNASDVALVAASSGKTLASLFTGRGNKRRDVSVLVGPLAETNASYIIRTAKPVGPNKVDISALLDAPEVWSILGEQVDIGPEVGGVVDTSVTVPILPWLTAKAQQIGGTLFCTWAVGRSQNADKYQVQLAFGATATDWHMIHNGAATEGKEPIDIPDMSADPDPTLRVRARVINRLGVPSAWIYTSTELFKPKINADLFDLDVTIEALSEALRKALGEVDEAGMKALRDAQARIDKIQADLDALPATLIGKVHERIDTIKVIQAEDKKQSFAAIQKAEYASSTANETEARTRETVMAQQAGEQKAIITQERLARISAEGALAQQTLDLQATLGGDIANLATYTNNIEVRVTNAEDGLHVTARDVVAMGVTLGDNTARLTRYAEVTDGISVKWGVTGNINGSVGGFILEGAQNIGGGVTWKMGIHADLFVDGSITGKKLNGQSLQISGRAQVGELVIGTEHIYPWSVTQLFGAVGSPARVTLKIRPGAKVMLHAVTGNTNAANGGLSLWRSINGGGFVHIASGSAFTYTTYQQVSDTQDRWDSITVMSPVLFIDTPVSGGPAGGTSVTYEARTSGSGGFRTMNATLVVQEMAK